MDHLQYLPPVLLELLLTDPLDLPQTLQGTRRTASDVQALSVGQNDVGRNAVVMSDAAPPGEECVVTDALDLVQFLDNTVERRAFGLVLPAFFFRLGRALYSTPPRYFRDPPRRADRKAQSVS